MRNSTGTYIQKGLLLTALYAAGLAGCNNQSESKQPAEAKAVAINDTARYTNIQWIDSVMDIGQVPMGRTAHIDFKFKNAGNYPLFVVDVVPGCGCTVADYPKEPIAPGGTGTITAAFDTNKGSEGDFRKNIMVTTNTKGQPNTVLYFSGTIVKGNNADSSGQQKS